MGLRTFWAQISGQRNQEIPLRSQFDFISSNDKNGAIVQARELDDLSSKVYTPAITSSHSGTGNLSRKRKSWFNGRTVHEYTIPTVPASDPQHIKQPRAALIKDSYSELGVLPEPFTDEGRRKSRRISLSRRASLRSIRNNYEPIDALPPMPALPAGLNQTVTAASHHPEQRKSRAMSFGRKSIDDGATKNKQRKRRSFWASSNPDNSEDDSVPPVPPLVRDGSQSPSSRHSRESKNDDIAPGSGTNGHRRTYTPRNAAAGFLMSTSGASDAARKSFRKSFHIADNDDLVCLTDEQRREWENLKSLTNAFVQDIERYENADCEKEPKYSNKQALAALEFGLR